MLKKMVFFSLLMKTVLIAFLGWGNFSLAASGDNRVMVIINGQPITLTDLRSAFIFSKTRAEKANVNVPEDNLFVEQVLENLIFQRIQQEEADYQGLLPDDTQITMAIQNIAQQNKMSESEFLTTLAKEGMTYDQLRGMVRDEMVLRRLRQQQIDSKVQVPDVEVDAVLQQKLKDTSFEYLLGQILIPVPEGASGGEEDRLREKAQNIRQQLLNGADFQTLAKQISQGDSSSGLMGWKALNDLPSLFVKEIVKLKDLQISSVFRSPKGFHILQVRDVRVPKSINLPGVAASDLLAPVPQAKVRQILIKPNSFLTDDGARAKLLGIRQQLMSQKASFDDMAKRFSQDTAAARGGDLGWVAPGDYPPEFEEAINNIPLNQVSQPFKTLFGWHLVEVLERKKESLPYAKLRDLVKQQLKENRSERLFAQWMDELRDRASVERLYSSDSLLSEVLSDS
jgi:peptidyl-prolyl cis-trans isomerase SurA